MFQYDFVINAFIAAGIVAVVSGVTGYFLVMRGQTFAGHALSHIGFAGATGAGLIGLSPLAGLVGFTLIAGVAMGLMGERLANRDVAIGVVLSLALGFYVSPYWYLLTGFVGLNLMQASLTGFCPAAKVFKLLGAKSGCAFN